MAKTKPAAGEPLTRAQLDNIQACAGVTITDPEHPLNGTGGKLVGRDYDKGCALVQLDEAPDATVELYAGQFKVER
jgi:hypothetical protein